MSNKVRPSSIELKHLRFAVKAAELGSFRRAADTIRVKQSTLSRTIRELEDSLGTSIFERYCGGVRATQAGDDFLRAVRSIIEQIDSLAINTHSAGQGEIGKLTIGFYTSLSSGNLRATLIDFKSRHPQIEVGMVENSRTRLLAGLRDGLVDVAIVTGEVAGGNDTVLPLWSERIFLALPKDHSLVGRDVIYWTDIRNEKVLLSRFDPGRELESILVSKFVCPEDRPRIEFQGVGRGVIGSLVSAGFGVSLVSESDTSVNLQGLIHRELRDPSGMTRIPFSARWQATNGRPALRNFIKLLEERYPPPAA
jgi:DNA-binding transcriptional LysR family regulator